jgi:hypothetical protein
VHPHRHEALEVRIDGAVLGGNGIKTRLRAPGGVPGPAGQLRLVKRLLRGKQYPRPRLRQVAVEVVQERGLAEAAFVAVEDDARRCGRGGEFSARAA